MTDHRYSKSHPILKSKIEFCNGGEHRLLSMDQMSPHLCRNTSIIKQPSLDLSTSRSENTTECKTKSSLQTVNSQKQINQQSIIKIQQLQSTSNSLQNVTDNKQQHAHQNPTNRVNQHKRQVELYILDYNYIKKAYKPIKIHSQSKGLFVKQLADFILSKPKYHIKTYKHIKQIQTQLKSDPKIIKPLVIPLAQGSQYATVFETVVFVKGVDFYISYDRFYIFVSRHFLPYTLVQIIKNIVKKQNEDRLRLGNNSYELDYNKVKLQYRQKLLEDINQIITSNEKYRLWIKKQQLLWYLRDIQTYDIQVRLNNLHYYGLPLLALSLFFIIRDYKIVFVAHKQHRHIISEIVMGLKLALHPIQYCHPTVFVTISEKHINYLDAPVPCLVGFWGEEKYCNRLVKHYSDVLYSDKKSGQSQSVLIDLSNMSITQKVLCDDESRQLTKLNQYSRNLNKFDSKSKKSLIERLNDYVLKQLIANKTKESAVFEKSLLYQTYNHNIKNSV